MSQRTGEVLIIIVVIALNLWLLGGGHSGRGQDYYETQTDVDYADYESP